jgi:hypothetical protein
VEVHLAPEGFNEECLLLLGTQCLESLQAGSATPREPLTKCLALRLFFSLSQIHRQPEITPLEYRNQGPSAQTGAHRLKGPPVDYPS